MARWNLATVVGVPGAGKTSLSRQVAASTGYRYINFGELMLDFAKKEPISTQDEMFQLPLDIQYKIWGEAANSIKDKENILLDLHGLDRSAQGYLISLPLDILKPQIIILVESTYYNIINRRVKDRHRKRPLTSFKCLKEEMELIRSIVTVASAMVGSYFVILKNDDFDESLPLLKKYL
jgi:adenylate kinase